MTLFKTTSRVEPSNTEVNEKKDEKNYNSSIIPTDDDNCTITIIVPPTARPVNSRYSMQYLKQFQHEQQSQQLYAEDYSPGRLGSPKQTLDIPRYSWKYILIITLISLILMITVGKYIFYNLLKFFIFIKQNNIHIFFFFNIITGILSYYVASTV